MFKRRRGLVVKCAVLIAAFWFGFAVYASTVGRWDHDGRSARSATQAAREDAGAVTGQHIGMPPPPTLEPLLWLAGRDDEKAKRDRELQEQFRRDQIKLKELLDMRKSAAVAATAAVDLRQYDPQTASLIRLGLIVPKWNRSEEMPEHLGAPGKWLHMFCGD